jgi:hypothetical protein
MVSMLWFLACSTPEETPKVDNTHPIHHQKEVGISAQAGEKNPPIPANDPVWANVNSDFKPVPMVYGEERWDDVSMRVFGHLAQATRDLARLDWQEGNQRAAIARYRKLATRLGALKLSEAGASRAMRGLHLKAANHHAAVLSQLADLKVGEPEHLGSNSRQRWLRAMGSKTDANEERPWQGLKIDGFVDFRDRHALRLRMTEYWLDSVDPIRFSDPWGYWRPAVADAVAEEMTATPSDAVAQAFPTRLSPEDIGRLPTGDSYLDTAGGAGPMAIGTLAVLGMNDPTHRNRLEGWANELNDLLLSDQQKFVQALETYKSELEGFQHGSRFYNIKQLINAGTRHLARAGHFKEALQVFEMHRPLHSQDWLCPNREGIQLGIEGRLMAMGGDLKAARTVLEQAQTEANDWLRKIKEAKKTNPRPPRGPPR